MDYFWNLLYGHAKATIKMFSVRIDVVLEGIKNDFFDSGIEINFSDLSTYVQMHLFWLLLEIMQDISTKSR